jgi:hypothetical protein
MPELEVFTTVEFRVVCSVHGDELDEARQTHPRRDLDEIHVKTCQKCLDAAREAGYNDGKTFSQSYQ